MDFFIFLLKKNGEISALKPRVIPPCSPPFHIKLKKIKIKIKNDRIRSYCGQILT